MIFMSSTPAVPASHPGALLQSAEKVTETLSGWLPQAPEPAACSVLEGATVSASRWKSGRSDLPRLRVPVRLSC